MNKVRVIWKNGVTTTVDCTPDRLVPYLANLPMADVKHVEFGEFVTGEGFATVIKPVDIDMRLHDGMFHLDMHTPDNKRVTTAKFSPAKFNDFGLRIMQQAHYEFAHMEHRLEGLDK